MDKRNISSCPNCSQPYHLKFHSPQPKGNLPLLLTCGHSMCETCVKNIVQFKEPIECKVCHRDMVVKDTDTVLLSQNKLNLHQIFPVNVYMLGELTLLLMEGSEKEKADEDYYIDLNAIIQSTDNTQGQCVECRIGSSKMCQQCSMVLCDNCFNKSHKNFIVFKNHVLQNIEPKFELNVCKIHKDKPLDYYCKDCSKAICIDCMMVCGEKSCKNHNAVSIQEVNEDFLEELNDMSLKVDETFKRLTKTSVDIGHLLYKIENDTGTQTELSQITASVEHHFSKLCATIQNHKQEINNIMTKLKSSEKESLQKAKSDVASAIKNARNVWNTINLVLDPKKRKQINLPAILEEAKQIINTPWYLSRDETKDPLKAAVNEDLCTLLSDYVHLEGNVNSTYVLKSTSDLGEDVDIPPPPTAPVYPPELPKDVRVKKQQKPQPKMFYQDAPKYKSKNSSNTSLNSLSSDSSLAYNKGMVTPNLGNYMAKPTIHPVSPFSESQHPKQLREGDQELIYISHIVDPHNFFVQRACHQTLVKEMLREFRNAVSLPKPSVNHVAEGKLYLVFNKADNMWQRCRVVSIDKTKAVPTFQVFCIDFGSTETVNIDKLRLLPPARVQSPMPLAINCSLANCEPRNGSWTSDDSYLIQSIIDNKQSVIHVRRIYSTSHCNVKYECDLTTFETGVSIAHALVFHERARMPNPKLMYPKIMSPVEKPKLFTGNNLKPQSVEEVYITHITSPDNFYVRTKHLQSVYEKLCEDLDQEYSMALNSGSVHLPEIGMVCVVNLDRCSMERGGWARAVVRELPGRGRVKVRLPDTGALVLVHWSALRHIRAQFTTLRALATECHLAGITPLNKKWNANSVALLRSFEDRLLELHVEDSRNRDSIGVTLYDNSCDDNIICINTEMIKHKFAVSFGLYMFKNKFVEDRVITNKTPLDEQKPRPKPKVAEMKILKKSQPPNTKINEEDLKAKDKGPLRLEAKLLHYQSPSCMYVSLIHQQKAFSELYDDMQKYYIKNNNTSKIDWKQGDRCSTLCEETKTWRRAVIMELQGDNAKIFYTDFAIPDTVPVANLRELIEEFASIGDAAIKCHLCGVIPAVGEEWPSLTKEYLKELLDAYKRVFITKLGNFKNESMPVEMWVYHTTQGGALEPNISEWRCLNKKIIEQGLGVPDKSHEFNKNDDEQYGDDNILSFLNLKGSINEWLQLEPLPTKPLTTIAAKSGTESYTTSSSPVCEERDTKTNEKTDKSKTEFISDWLPPEPLASKEFTAMPTYIDNDGIIYLHDISQQDTLDLIRKALDVRFKDPDPKAKYAKWTVGEPCIALYFLDNRFYRGRVMEVNQESSTCLIHYIDYGNEEACSFVNMRKSIALYQIPIQAHKCVLNRIRPTGNRWDRTALDYIHKSIVEKQCFVKVTGEPIDDIIPIDLKYDKLWINDHLVDFEMAEYTDGSKPVVRKYAPVPASETYLEEAVVESDSGPDYIVDDERDVADKTNDSFDMTDLQNIDWNKIIDEDEKEGINGTFITYPKNDDEFMCNIAIINDAKKLQLSIIHNDENNTIYEEMFKSIQEEGESLSPLNGVYENKACIALFHEDGLWYRAAILQYSETQGKVKVLYVDYGNIEVVPLADIREINEEWAKLPPANVMAKLHGIEVNPDIDVAVIAEEYKNTLLGKGPFRAKIVNYENSLPSVELRNDDGELVYNELITKGIFLPV